MPKPVPDPPRIAYVGMDTADHKCAAFGTLEEATAWTRVGGNVPNGGCSPTKWLWAVEELTVGAALQGEVVPQKVVLVDRSQRAEPA